MKSITEYICESSEVLSKCTGFSSTELKRFATIVSRLNKFKNLDKLNITGNVHIEFGHQYIVRFKNPFTDPHKFSAKAGKRPVRYEDTEPDTITALGVGDKVGTLHLVNVWNNEESVTMKWMPRHAKEMRTSDGKKRRYMIPPQWVLHRPKLKGYRVREMFDKEKGKKVYVGDKVKSNGIYSMPLEIQFVIDAYKLKDKMEGIDAAEERKANRIKEERAMAAFKKRITVTAKQRERYADLDYEISDNFTDTDYTVGGKYKVLGTLNLNGDDYNYPDWMDARILRGDFKYMPIYMEDDDFESDFKFFYSDHCLVNTHRNEIYVLRIDPNSPDAVYRFFYDRLNEK